MVVGQLVESAALGIKHTLVDAGYLPVMHTRAEFQLACQRYVEAFGSLHATSQYQPPPGLRWDDEKYVGDAYGTYAWAAYVAEVSVDVSTWEVRVDDFRRRAGSRQGDQPGPGERTDRRRRRAGHRMGALRERGHGKTGAWRTPR